jgi:hypothetical protein
MPSWVSGAEMPELDERWQPVASRASSLGVPAFAAALAAVPRDDLDLAWTPEQAAEFTSLTPAQRTGLIRDRLAAWQAGEADTVSVAAAVRALLESAPPPERVNGWQRPAFAPGNALHLVHGAQSERRIAAELPAEVERIRAVLADDLGPDAQHLDGLLVERLARAVVRLRHLDAYLDRLGGPLDATGRPRGAVELLMRQERMFLNTAHLLGMTPMARARIAADRASGARDAVAAARDAEAELRERYGR